MARDATGEALVSESWAGRDLQGSAPRVRPWRGGGRSLRPERPPRGEKPGSLRGLLDLRKPGGRVRPLEVGVAHECQHEKSRLAESASFRSVFGSRAGATSAAPARARLQLRNDDSRADAAQDVGRRDP